MSRLIFIVLFICLGFSVSLAQDTAKKKVPVKTYPIYKPRKYHSSAYYHRRDSILKKRDTALNKTADSTAPPPTDKSLNGQYQYLLSKVYHYQQPLISALWKNASDTLTANRGKLNAALNKAKIQNKVIDSLTGEIATLSAANERRDAVDVLGVDLSKTTYNLIVWGLVIFFALAAIMVVGRSGSHRREARYRTQLYNELEEEFKTYKAKANDKEKKLARELQTERNKLDELLGRG